MRPRPRPLPVVVAAVAVAAVTTAGWVSACATTGPAPPPGLSPTRALSPALAHDAYVWQRAWTPAVRRAVLAHGPAFRRLVVLAAEVAWPRQGEPRVARAQVDYATLRRAVARAGGRLRVGLALRVGPWTAARQPHAQAGRALAALAARALARARAAGVEPAELHVDYDAPTAGLAAYAAWLRQLRPRLGGVPLTITALPAWLDSPDLPALLATTDGWVLQVHSLVRPRGPDDLPPLTDPARARQWVARAARLSAAQARATGRPLPLRVALPTYGYEVGFRPDGALLGLRAEAPLFLRGLPGQRWPPGTRVRALRADAPALSHLVRAWSRERAAGHLAALAGVAWYRLPVATDRLTWRWITLRAVLAGRPVAPRVVAALTPASHDARLVDLVAHNDGLADGALPARLVVTAPASGPSPVLFAEALAGYELAPPTARTRRRWVFRRTPAGAAERLAPKARRRVGWLRLQPGRDRDALRLEPAASTPGDPHAP